MTEPSPAPSPRTVAYIIWGSLLVGVLLFAGVAAFVGPSTRAGMTVTLPEALPIGALGLSLALLVASRVVPGMMGAGAAPLSRNIVAQALCEGGALAGIGMWMITGSPQALAAVVVGLVGMLLCFPGDARWRHLGGMEDAGRAGAPGDRSGGPGFGAR